MRGLLLRPLVVLALAAALCGCGKSAPTVASSPATTSAPASAGGEAAGLVTKNTTRLGGGDPASDAAAVAQAVYPGLTAATRPQAVVIVDEHSWPAALAASVLASEPLGAPLLYADGGSLPPVTEQALRTLHPSGVPALGGAQVIRIGTAASLPYGYRAMNVPAAADPASAAAAVDRTLQALRGPVPRAVIALDANVPQPLQMPAAGLAAESGAPIVFISPTGVPPATAALLRTLHRPSIYLLSGPAPRAAAALELARLGHLVPVAGSHAPGPGEANPAGGPEAVDNAIAVARFADGSFGWDIHEAGHGLVFANATHPLDGPAAAPLSAHGDYGPLLLLEDSASVPTALAHYLSDIEPGYTAAIPPVRAVYNHGWLIGGERAISPVAQAEIDSILEVAPRGASAAEASVAYSE